MARVLTAFLVRLYMRLVFPQRFSFVLYATRVPQRFSFVFICGSCSHSVSRLSLYAARVPTAFLVRFYMRLVFPQRFSFAFICGSCSHSGSRLSLYAARVPTAFLVRPNFVSCFFNLMETRRNRLSTSETIGLGWAKSWFVSGEQINYLLSRRLREIINRRDTDKSHDILR